MRRAPVGGADYPRSYAEFRSWFPDGQACLDYLGLAPLAGGLVLPDERSWRRLNLS